MPKKTPIAAETANDRTITFTGRLSSRRPWAAAKYSVTPADGTLSGLAADGSKTRRLESFIHVEVDRTTDNAALETLAIDITRVAYQAGTSRL